MDAEKITALIEPLIEQESAELVDVAYAKEGSQWMLRVFLDKEGGITLDDCAYFSDRIGGLLDATDSMDRSYVLEVSSPGMDRVIKKEKDFARFSGKPVKVELKQNFQGRRRFRGELKGLRDGKVLVACGPETLEFPAQNVAEIRLDLPVDL